ncbi:LPXTG cell wall anchor domain-containing protein [Arthrobacter sp. G119Y2]|uniref:LPXTG cell wall anchor domain-containing protein n=1 Tax=Arthrobacter sp. G119Y2 TaxID=3134965 RepID=UPI003119750E
MQDNTSAFYKRVGALGAATALAVSGAFIASPAIASPTGEPDATSADAPVTTATEAPASEPAVDETVTGEATEEAVSDEAEATEEAGTLPPGLAEALLRDLGMTVEEFEAAGELGKKAADALPELQATEGFVGIAIEDAQIVITGSGEALEALALKLDATLVAPAEEAEVTEAPADEATDAPSAEATEAAEKPAAEEETAAPMALPSNHGDAIAAIRADYIANVGVQGLQSILWDGNSYVISVDQTATIGDSVLAKSLADVTGTPAQAIADKYQGVRIANSSGTPTSVEDVVSGQGYASPMGGGSYALCSIGFNGFNAAGDPAVITAGHCAQDGAVKEAVLTDPSGDEASGSDNFDLGNDLGTWGFSQFGGPNNTPVNLETGENVGTDIAAIDGINSELDLLPEVTQWADATDLTATTTKITGTVDAVVGAPVCKSGRTTGWSCGEVTGIGEFPVGGHNMATNPDDVRGVKGFESTLTVNAASGDSGGPTISGSSAMGINSAVGDREGVARMFSTSLSDGLGYLGGYSVAVFVDAPQLTSHEDKGTVLTDAAITGTAPAGSIVKLTRGDDTIDLDVVDGAWSFPAPSTVPEDGKLAFTVQAVNGYNKSTAASYELTVKNAPLAAPVITTPANGAAIADSVAAITGTGAVDADVKLSVTGTASGSAVDEVAINETVTVNADGTWELKLNDALTYGTYTVTAVQDGIAGKEASPEAVSTFSVILEKAVITSITEGQDFAEGENPRDISGTGTAGAKVAVTIGENTLSATVGDNGDWKVTGVPVLAPGAFTVSAVQTLDGATSEATVMNFTVTAVVVEEAAPPVVPPAPAPDNNGDGLPDTGAAGMGLFAGAGALLTAGGISALLINRRRQLQDA